MSLGGVSRRARPPSLGAFSGEHEKEFLLAAVAAYVAGAGTPPDEERKRSERVIAEAESLLSVLELRARSLDRAVALARAGRCRGLLHAATGDFDEAVHSLNAALEQHRRAPQAVEQARTLVALGIVERRANRRRAARETLERALASFEAIGTAQWAQRTAPGVGPARAQTGCRRRTHPCRAAGRGARGIRHDQPRDRRGVLHQSRDGRGQPRPDLPQIGNPLPC
jgi:tetratricopeptide (TPR) repeat protein